MSALDLQVTSAELGALVGLTARRINQFAEAGKLVRVARNRFRLADAMPVLMEELCDGGDKASELQVERVRKLRAEATMAELELAKAVGAVALVSEFERAQNMMVGTIRTNLLQVPSRAVLQLLGCTDESSFKQKLRDEIILALVTAAEEKFDIEEDETP
jgi:phage terminase Nu1 subunit (DNA packaging protein)